MSKVKDGGITTAYGAAVRGGYEGTYAQFCADLGKLAEVLSEFLGFSVNIETLAEGEVATASYDGGILSLGIPRGNTGNGIQSIVLNADYTLTVTYTNGNTWTSGSIRGQVGATPHLTIGTVQTLEPGQSATAEITGTDENPVLNFGIPKGQAGASDAGSVSYDPEGSYDEGTVGAELQEQNRQLSDKQDKPATAGTAGQVLGLDDQLQPVWLDQTGGSSDDAAPVIINTASGDIASFADGADNRKIRKIVGTIVPVQEGSGDPSPNNIRPISGWTAAVLGNTVPAPESGITFPFEPKQAGSGDPSPTNIRPISGYDLTLEDETHVTVYGGTVTLNEDGSADVVASYGSRKLNNSIDYFDLSSSKTLRSKSGYSGNFNAIFPNAKLPATNHIATETICEMAKAVASAPITYKSQYDGCFAFGPNSVFYLVDTNCSTIEDYLTKYGDALFCYPLDTPTTYHFSNIGNLKTFLDEIGYTAQILPINWQSEAGTIYGGTVTLNEDGSADVVENFIRKRVTAELGQVNFNEARVRYTVADMLPVNDVSAVSDANYKCNMFPKSSGSTASGVHFTANSDYTTAFIGFWGINGYGIENTLAGWNQFITDNEVYVTYQLATPITYHFDNIGQLYTYLGTNNVWIDTGAITECDYPADTKLYIDGKIAEMQATILENIGG